MREDDQDRERFWRNQPWSDCNNVEIGRRTGYSETTARRWRKRQDESVPDSGTDVPNEGTPDDVPASPYDTDELHGVRKHATPEQGHAIDSLVKHGSVLDAALALDITPERLRGLLTEAKRKAARKGWSPEHDMTEEVPAGFHVKGVSTYYGKDGERRGQWVKSNKDQEHRLQLLLDGIQRIAEPFRGKSERVATPKDCDADLLTIYPIADVHLGLYSWAEETGEAFDLAIAESALVTAIDNAVALAPPSEQAIVMSLGDFFHTDSSANTTARAGNALDVDTRYPKIVAAGVRAMRRCVDQARTKHKTVYVICAAGNHSDDTDMVLAICLAMYYENDKRVIVDTSPDPFHWHRFGKCLIGVTHGAATKPDKLPGVMATLNDGDDWGKTRHRYWYTGHIHHDTLKEYPGCIVESFRAVTVKDAWHHAAGYRSGRDVKCDVLHRERGRINRHIVGVGEPEL